MRGAGLCLLSAAAFGTLGIFGRLASDAGADTATTLLVRFGLAALVFAAVLAWTGGWRALRGLSRRVVLTGLALGAAGYSLQSGLYFAAIGRLDVSLVALLLYTYPAFVTIAALALGRLAPSPRIGAALALASAGLVLVLVASVTGLATGSIDFALPAEAWLWLVLIALVSTVVAVSAFFAGLRRVGPSEAA